jgi:choline/glycine/proline betaine transport protein
LQTAAIAVALPVSVIMLMLTFGILISLDQQCSAIVGPENRRAPDGISLRRELRA